MPAPLVPIAIGLAVKAASKVIAKKTAKKTASKFPTSNVKKLPRKTAPKSGLETRGAKLSSSEKSARNKKIIAEKRFDKIEKRMELKDGNQMYGTKMKSAGASKKRKTAKESKVLKKPSIKKIKGK